MNELQRLHYLDAMGIDTYMPRWVLPKAPVAVACTPVVSERDKVVEVTATAQTAVEALERSDAKEPALAPSRVDDVLSIVAATPSLPENKSPAAAPTRDLGQREEVQPEPDTDVSFSLSVWRVSEDLLVVDSRHSELALPTESLLSNILLALGYGVVTLPRAEVISWPMFDNVSAPKGEAAAREAIAAMLEGMLESNPVKYCLLMGEEAGYFVLPSDILPVSQQGSGSTAVFDLCQGKTFPLAELNATAMVVPGLSAMLQQPHLKALTWKTIQPLRLR